MLPPRIVALPEPGELLENGLRERLLGQRIPALENPPLARPLRIHRRGGPMAFVEALLPKALRAPHYRANHLAANKH